MLRCTLPFNHCIPDSLRDPIALCLNDNAAESCAEAAAEARRLLAVMNASVGLGAAGRPAVVLGLGRIVALYGRSSTLFQIHEYIRYFYV